MAFVVRLKVAEMRPAVSNHLEKTAAGMKILRVLLEVLCELVNLLGKERDLNAGGTGVSIVLGDIFNDRRLFLRGKHE